MAKPPPKKRNWRLLYRRVIRGLAIVGALIVVVGLVVLTKHICTLLFVIMFFAFLSDTFGRPLK